MRTFEIILDPWSLSPDVLAADFGPFLTKQISINFDKVLAATLSNRIFQDNGNTWKTVSHY